MAVVELSPPEIESVPDREVVVFVGGCDRSGTTLAGRLLAEEFSLVMLPEAYFHARAYRRFGAGVASSTAARHWRRRSWGLSLGDASDRQTLSGYLHRRMVDLHDERRGPGAPLRVVESTPENIEIGSILLREFPDAHLVHVVRDPRGVAASLKRVDFGPATAQECARLWKQRVASGLALELRHPGRVHRLQFEDLLVLQLGLRELQSSIPPTSIVFDRARDLMVEFSTRTVQERAQLPLDIRQAWAWRSVLSARQVAAIEYECRELMELFGYPLSGVPDARAGTRRRVDALVSAANEITIGSARRALRVGRALLRR